MTDSSIPWWWTQLGDAEVEGVARCIRGGHINQGSVCRELERRLGEQLECEHVVVTTSGSGALALAMLACGVGPGDEVIVPAVSFIATAHAPMLLGAKVRIADVRADRPLIDVDQIERIMTDRTRVIVPVHLNGAGCDIASVRELVAGTEIKIVEDAAQAFMSRNKHGWLGTQGDIGTFSMSLTKLISTGEGGFLVPANGEFDGALRKLRNQGVADIADNMFDGFGFNFRFNDLQAGVGLAQLEQLTDKLAAVRRVYNFYHEKLAGLHYLKMFEIDLTIGELPLWTQVYCAEREKVIQLLHAQGIQARAFHPSLTDSPHLNAPDRCPNAEAFAATGLTLPSGPNQSDEDLDRTVAALHSIAGEIQTDIESYSPFSSSLHD